MVKHIYYYRLTQDVNDSVLLWKKDLVRRLQSEVEAE